jgi:DNA-binding response OmpR family regulator
MIGKSDFELHPFSVAAAFFADDQQVIRSGGVPKLDIDMPVMDGTEAIKHIRASWRDLPVIALTRRRYGCARRARLWKQPKAGGITSPCTA